MASEAAPIDRAALHIAGGTVTATNIAGTINNYGASAAELEAMLDRRFAAMVATLAAKEAARDDGMGVERQTIVAAAQRLNPAELADPQAIREVERAVDTARATIAHDGANLDGFVEGVFARVADATARGDFDSGAEAIDAGLANLEAEYRQSRIAMLEQAIRVDELRRDAPAVAQRIALLVGVDAPGTVPEWLPIYREHYQRYFNEGLDNQNFPLAVAAELARRMLRTARDAAERREAARLLGDAQCVLGARETTPDRLGEAIDCYQHALRETEAAATPGAWASLQFSLASALQSLGEREPGTALLDAARDAYRAVADMHAAAGNWPAWASATAGLGSVDAIAGERATGSALLESAVATIESAIEWLPRDAATREWAETQMSLGWAIYRLAERDPEPEGRFNQVHAAYQAALDATPRDRFELYWAYIQNSRGALYNERGLRTGDTSWYHEAIVAYQNALQVFTRDQTPLNWAATHSNLGYTLLKLGLTETGTARIEAAVAAYRAALEITDRATLPLDWAISSGDEGVALLWLADRRDDLALALDARARIVAALRVVRDGGHLKNASYYEDRLPEAAAVIARLGGPHDLEEP